MQDLLKEKFGYEIPSEDPVIVEPGSFENPDSLVIDFAQFLIKLRDHKSGTIVDRFLLYYHGHGAQVLGKPCILTGTWEAIPLVELVNLVIKYINPQRYFVINDCCSNSLDFDADTLIARMKEAQRVKKAKGFEDRYLEINAAPPGHRANALPGKTLTSALVSVLEENLRQGKVGVPVLELEDLLRKEQERQKSDNFPTFLMRPALRNDFFPTGHSHKGPIATDLKKIQNSQWAGPIAPCLKTASTLVTLVPDPGGTVLEAALSLGTSIFKPDPDLADDLQGAKEVLKGGLKDVAFKMANIRGEVSALRIDVGDMLKLMSDREFYEGIETIDAHHQFYMEGLHNLEDTNESFRTVEASFQITFNKHFRVEKIFKFLKTRGS